MASKPKSTRRKGRRARGTGSIFQRPDGRWVGRKVIGKSPTGKTLYLERQGRTQAEVIAKLAEASPPGPDTTVATWVTRWLDGLQVRPATRAAYTHTANAFVVPTLGHLRLSTVTAHDVERAIKEWTGTGLATSTIRQHLAHVRILFRAAVRFRLITSNPAADARKPKAVKKEIDPFTPAELASIIGAADDSAAGNVFALLAATGCRVGEACGLDVPDFDPVAGTVAITKTYDLEHGIGPPKSPHSVRTIRVPSPALPCIRSAIGSRTTGPLFLTNEGGRRHQQGVWHGWKPFLRRLGLRYRNPHQLRHSVATALVADGVPLADVAAYLGDTVETVVRTYLHKTGADPAAAMEGLLGGGKVGGRLAETRNAEKNKAFA